MKRSPSLRGHAQAVGVDAGVEDDSDGCCRSLSTSARRALPAELASGARWTLAAARSARTRRSRPATRTSVRTARRSRTSRRPHLLACPARRRSSAAEGCQRWHAEGGAPPARPRRAVATRQAWVVAARRSASPACGAAGDRQLRHRQPGPARRAPGVTGSSASAAASHAALEADRGAIPSRRAARRAAPVAPPSPSGRPGGCAPARPSPCSSISGASSAASAARTSAGSAGTGAVAPGRQPCAAESASKAQQPGHPGELAAHQGTLARRHAGGGDASAGALDAALAVARSPASLIPA